MITNKLKAHFADYSAYHRTKGNQYSHYIGITLIVMTLLGLLSQIKVGPTDAGVLLWAGAIGYCLSIDWKITIPYSFVILGFYFFGRQLPSNIAWTLFVIGWIAQGIGHYVYEKKSPAFFTNLKHVFIGPLWIFAKAVGYGSVRS
ncbi:MAG: DUF962 domain-containing protein [Xanthomonadaceae bacterium]|nr:DUF962 domain-containing protein [Xanthomonadaceae bacterium]